MYGRLISLDKQPVVRPVGVGETWQHLFDKIVLKVTGPEETMACKDDQLCSGRRDPRGSGSLGRKLDYITLGILARRRK